jgi:hypothetical protein
MRNSWRSLSDPGKHDGSSYPDFQVLIDSGLMTQACAGSSFATQFHAEVLT